MEHPIKPFAVKCAFISACFLATLLGYQCFNLLSWSGKPLILKEEVIVDVPKGVSLRQLAAKLEEKSLISSQDNFVYWTKIRRNFKKFQAGTYQFKDFATPDQIIAKIVQGEVYKPLVLQFTIPEGFTLKQINERLAALGVSDLKTLDQLSKDTDFMKSLGLDTPNLEGFLYPATYSFYTHMPSDREVYQALVNEFYKRLPANYVEELKKFNISLYEAVIIASMIEKETMLGEEKPKISEVIWNRLRDRVPLAIDATLIYGIADYQGNISRKHLRDASNPYNTRIHLGLPPSPIGAVSRAALEAVVKPTNEGHYFYVLLPGPEKKHHFSKSLKEHNKYVQKLVNALKVDQNNRP